MRLSQEPIHGTRGFLARRRRNQRVNVHPLRRETTAKVGIAMKRPMAGWDIEDLQGVVVLELQDAVSWPAGTTPASVRSSGF